MANAKKRRRKPRRKHYRINIATIVSFVILGYLVVRMIMSLMQPAVSTYEVTSQKIFDTISTTGLAIRDEKVVATSNAGYITYYVADGERVGVNSTIYAMDQTGSIRDKINADDGIAQLSDEDYVDIKNQIIDYKNTYSDSDFASIYDFKYALDNNIMEITNDSIISQVDELIANGNGGYTLNQVSAGESGVISYCYDGLETTTLDTLSAALFQHPQNDMKQIRTTDMYEANSPAYRLITNENWDLVVSLTDAQYAKVKDKKYLEVKFLKDDLTVTRGVTFIEQDGCHFAALSFNKYMERYMDERYLNVDIILDSQEGLKLPKSSLVSSNLYEIPQDYAVESDETASGISFNVVTYDKNGNRKASVISPAVSYKDEETGNFYISRLDLNDGDVLVRNATEDEIKSNNYAADDTYTVGATKKFEGVYTINKGYAQFVVIGNLYETDDFCIAKDDTEYGISQYDHVVLDSKSIKEGQVIY